MNHPAPIGVGVIGAGAMGRVYGECLRRFVSGARLVAMAGGRRAGELAREYGVDTELDVEALLDRRDVNAVIIASPETAHCAQTLAAAARGQHVLVEKPMAPDPEQCDRMIAACTEAGVTLMVVKHWRFRGVHTRARTIIAGGEIGPVSAIANETNAALSASLSLVARKPFYVDPAGGGLLMGWAVHNLDWVCHLMGKEPERIRLLAPLRVHPVLGASHFDAELAFAAGITARVTVAIDLPELPAPNRIFHTRVCGQRDELDLDGYGQLRLRRGGCEEIRWTQPAFDATNPIDPLRLEAYAAMVQAFVDAIHRGTAPPVTGEDGRRAVALFRAIVGGG